MSLDPRPDDVIIPLDLTQLSCPGFTLTAGLPSGFTTDGVGYSGGALWRACNLTSFSPCLSGPVDHPFASRHKGLGFKSPGGDLCETGILLLALSRYKLFDHLLYSSTIIPTPTFHLLFLGGIRTCYPVLSFVLGPSLHAQMLSSPFLSPGR
jgi:hypothetical protein